MFATKFNTNKNTFEPYNVSIKIISSYEHTGLPYQKVDSKVFHY